MCCMWDCGGLGDVPQCVVRGTVVGWEMYLSVSYVGLWWVGRCTPVCSTWDCGRLGDVPQCVIRGTVVGWEIYLSVSYVGLW